MLLSELVASKRVQFCDRFDTWEDAVAHSFDPLLQDGSVEQAYIESVINCVKKYGPYIVLAPNLALPHAQENAVGVKQNAICFMKVKYPVEFEPGDTDKNVRLFFSLASVNHSIHLDNMQKLAEVFLKEGVIDALLEAETVEDLVAIDKKFFK